LKKVRKIEKPDKTEKKIEEGENIVLKF